MGDQKIRSILKEAGRVSWVGARLLGLSAVILLLDACGGRTLEPYPAAELDSGDGGSRAGADGDVVAADGSSVGDPGRPVGGGKAIVPGPGAGGLAGSGGLPMNTGSSSATGGAPATLGGMGGEGSEACGDFSCPEYGECFEQWEGDDCIRHCSLPSLTTLATNEHLQSLASLSCHVLTEWLAITGDEISSLAGLSTIREIEGSLTVAQTTRLADLQGLQELAIIGGALNIQSTADFGSLSGLESLTFLGTALNISGNSDLVDLSALARAEAKEIGINISSNSSLVDLRGLEAIRSSLQLIIATNTSLLSLQGLENLGEVEGSLVIASNPALTSMVLPGLGVVTGNITVSDQPLAQELRMDQLEVVTNTFVIAANGVTAVDLGQLQSVSSMTIVNNPELLTLGGLPSLATIDSLIIADNSKFPQCEADAIDARVGACNPCQDNDPTGSCD